MEAVIRANGLGKEYVLGESRPLARLRDAILRRGAGVTDRRIWALRNATFSVDSGEVVGIIGRNGAGKSTLLKLLSRVTAPTEGSAEIHGRVGSLLEVGTGFHPELTGRENVFLNGAILGMSRGEIRARFDEIVEFAGVGPFMDTPVKRYSSGMYLRLAFSVAAHLEPDILIVDEVLAVGDRDFQQKCLGKMRDASQSGRTILLVSHQMNAIRRLCTRCIWIDGGRVRMEGATADVVASYEGAALAAAGSSEGRVGFLSWSVREKGRDEGYRIDGQGAVSIALSLQVKERLEKGSLGIAIRAGDGTLIWATSFDGLHLGVGRSRIVVTLPTLPIKPGIYSVQTSLWNGKQLVDLWDAVPQLVVAAPPLTHHLDEWSGVLNVPASLTLEEA